MPLLPPSTPCGRSELLGWINQLCSAEYPTIESLRDGAAYCTVIEAAASRLAKNCTAVGIPEFNRCVDKAAEAKMILSKVDWSATSHVYEVADPALDPPHVRNTCLKNMITLQKMLRECVFQELSLEIHGERLAAGKRQDHMQFLNWLATFIRKVLTHFSKAQLKKKVDSSAPLIERVKVNRALELREVRRHEDTGLLLRSSSRPNNRHRADHKSNAERPGIGLQTTTRDRTVSCPPSTGARGEGSRKPGATGREAGYGVKEGSTPSSARTRSEPRVADAPLHAASARASSADHRPVMATSSSFSIPEGGRREGQGTGVLVIPESYKDAAIKLREKVEQLERIALEEHQRYQESILPSGAVEEETGVSAVKRVASLVDLWNLLEERDALAQVYLDVEEVVRRRLERGGASTPLLMHICSVLYPSQEI